MPTSAKLHPHDLVAPKSTPNLSPHHHIIHKLWLTNGSPGKGRRTTREKIHASSFEFRASHHQFSCCKCTCGKHLVVCCGSWQLLCDRLRMAGKRLAEKRHKFMEDQSLSAINEKLEKFIETSTMARQDHEKMKPVQQSLAGKKLEAAKLAHKTAQEQTKCKMLDIYKDFMFAPTSHLSDEALAEKNKAMESMRLTMRDIRCISSSRLLMNLRYDASFLFSILVKSQDLVLNF